MPINDILLDAATRHQVFLLRYGGATANQVTAILDEAATDLAKRIKGKLARLSPAAREASLQPGVKRLQAILTDVRAQRRDIRRAMVVATRGDLVKLANIEVDIAERRLTEAIGVDLGNFRPSPEVLRSIVTDEAMRGKRIGEWFTQLSDQHRSRLEGAVRLGLIEGRTTPQIIRDLRAATEITKRSATTLVRTSVNHVANRARESLYEANKDVVKGMRWSATLDGRTSEICISRDGVVTPVGDAKQSELDGEPLAPSGARPPAHPNCRSIMSPITRSWRELSGKDLKPGRGAARIDDIFDKRLKAKGFKPGQISKIKRNTRASMNGQVPVKQTYPEWLKRQPAGFQDEVLGKTKGKLFRDGGLAVDKFVDAQSGRPFTLDQLRVKNEQAFMRADLPVPEVE